MWEIFKRTIRDRRMVFLIYIIAASGFLLMHISIFPSFKDQQIDVSKMLESVPQGFVEAFGLNDYDLSVFESYISSEEFSLIWPLLLLIMTISFAGGSIAAEIEKGTIEILLSQPISRTKLFLSRYFSGLSLVALFILVTISLMVVMAKMFGIDIQLDHYPTLALSSFLFSWAVYSIAMFLSATFSDKGKVYFISAGILVLMYAINIVSNLKDSLDKLKYISFFHYYNSNDILIRNNLDEKGVIVFLSIILVFFFAGLVFFNRRDITT